MINDTILNAIREILYFNIWESIFYVLFFAIEFNKKVSIKYFFLHIIILSIINWSITNFIVIPFVMQICLAIAISLYFMYFFKTVFKKTLITVLKSMLVMLVIEVFFVFGFNLFSIDISKFENSLLKVLYFIPIRICEFSYLYIKFIRREKNENLVRYN